MCGANHHVSQTSASVYSQRHWRQLVTFIKLIYHRIQLQVGSWGKQGSPRPPLLVSSAILGEAASLGNRKEKHHRSWVMEGNRTAQNSSFPLKMEKIAQKVPVSGTNMEPCPGNSHKVPETGKSLSLFLQDMEEIPTGIPPAVRAVCLKVPFSAKRRTIVLVLLLITFGFLFTLRDAFKKRREKGVTVTPAS